MIVWAIRCSKTNRIMKGRADGARMSLRSRQILWWCKDVLYTCNPIHQWHKQIYKKTQFVHWLKNLKSANYFCILFYTNSWILAHIQLSIFPRVSSDSNCSILISHLKQLLLPVDKILNIFMNSKTILNGKEKNPMRMLWCKSSF